MEKIFHLYCPTKEKEVTLITDYLYAGCLDDKQKVYIKGRTTCIGSENCDSCKLCNSLPQEIRQ